MLMLNRNAKQTTKMQKKITAEISPKSVKKHDQLILAI